MAHSDEFDDEEEEFEGHGDSDIERIQEDMGREKYYVSIFADAVPESEKQTYLTIRDKADRLIEMVKSNVSEDVDVAFELDNGFFNHRDKSLEANVKALADTINKLAPDAFTPETLAEYGLDYIRAKHLQYAGDRYLRALGEGDESGKGRESFIGNVEKALGSSEMITNHLVRAFESEAASYGLHRPGQGR